MKFSFRLKAIAKFFIGLFALMGLCIVLWLAWVLYINLFDEQLTPEAEAMLSWRAEAVPDAENGYVMMAGFTAPSGSDWKKVGAERIARHNEQVRAYRKSGNENEIKIPAEEEDKNLEFSECDGCEKILRLSSRDNEAVLLVSLQTLLQQQEQIDKALKDNAELIHRYEALQSASAYSETALPYSNVLIGFGEKESSFFPIRQLLLSKITLAALSSDREPLLDFLERDISFWRLVMKSDSMLITSMSASIGFMRELRLLRTLLAQIDFSTPELERLRYLLTPLSAEEQSLLRTLEYECNGFANILLTGEKYYFHPGMRSSEIFLHKWLFQPQATVNIFAERTRLWKELASLSSFGFAVRHDAVPKAFQKKEEVIEMLNFFHKPFNYLGYSDAVEIAKIMESAYEEVIAIRHDLAAALLLTRVQLELRLAGIDAGKNPEAVPEFLEQADDETFNPYTGMPFEWNEACRRLRFMPQHANYRGFSEVTLAEIPEENAAACAALAAPSVRSRNSD